MALRVTQQNIEVLADASGGKLRVTQQYVEVMGASGSYQTISDTISLTDSATETDLSTHPASSTLGLTDAASEVRDHTESITSALTLTDAGSDTDLTIQTPASTLTLTDAATLPATSVPASNDLSVLTDSAVASGVPFESVSHTLSLLHVATSGVIVVNVSDALSLLQSPYAGQNVLASASNAISFAQGDTPGIYFASASNLAAFIQEALGDTGTNLTRFLTDPMSLADSASAVITDFARSLGLDPPDLLRLLHTVQVAGPKFVSVSDVLGFTNIPSEHQGVANVSLTDYLNLQQSAGQVKFVTAADILVLTQIAFRRVTADNVLLLAQAASGFIARPGLSALALTDTVSRIFVAGRSFSDNLGLNSSVTAFIDDIAVRCQYHPFIGVGPGASVPTAMPTLGTAKVTLTYPFVSPSTTLVLRNPQFGNIDRLAFDRINRETRGGTLIMFVDSKWNKQQVMNVTITALKRSQKDALLSFLNTSIGQDIGYLDHEDRQWKGLVLTPEAIVTNNDRGGYTVTFELEGTLQ